MSLTARGPVRPEHVAVEPLRAMRHEEQRRCCANIFLPLLPLLLLLIVVGTAMAAVSFSAASTAVFTAAAGPLPFLIFKRSAPERS